MSVKEKCETQEKKSFTRMNGNENGWRQKWKKTKKQTNCTIPFKSQKTSFPIYVRRDLYYLGSCWDLLTSVLRIVALLTNTLIVTIKGVCCYFISWKEIFIHYGISPKRNLRKSRSIYKAVGLRLHTLLHGNRFSLNAKYGRCKAKKKKNNKNKTVRDNVIFNFIFRWKIKGWFFGNINFISYAETGHTGYFSCSP